MAGDDTPPPPPPQTTTADKLIPFSITNKVPVKLSLEKHNYNAWSSFFKIHLGSLGLKPHIEANTITAPSYSDHDPEWCKLDDLIKMWILGSLCDSLQEQVVSTPGNAKDLWITFNGYSTTIRMLGLWVSITSFAPSSLARCPSTSTLPKLSLSRIDLTTLGLW